MKFHPRKSAKQFDASRSASQYSSSCFLPDGKTARSSRCPTYPLAVFFRDKTSNNNPFLTAESSWRRLNRVFVAIREPASQFLLQIRCFQLVIRRDVKNHRTLDNAVVLAELQAKFYSKILFSVCIISPLHTARRTFYSFHLNSLT